MNWIFSIYVAILFFLLTPRILLSLPSKGSKYTVAAVHAIVFAVLLHFSGSFISNCSSILPVSKEGLRNTKPPVTRETTEEEKKNVTKVPQKDMIQERAKHAQQRARQPAQQSRK
uniref:Uncharacterized protein n=1 Tax=viral metagenome TaxID=1070528 RepID=A0A6C0DLE7_9ZZZZ